MKKYTLIKINSNVCFFKTITFRVYIYRFDSRSPTSRIDFDTMDKIYEALDIEVGDLFTYIPNEPLDKEK
ncbi:helix-turn-helix domain-containing protein [Psychrobacter sp. NZS113]|uniref:helix-turn-helix domain-containing protein n=1 Tax=Psychrobacter sp. NZS113 TaxID=2792045 RepID=UPI002A0A7DAE|nr:helix-turn-helix domain-containing protein [Psychrobacter sp. NZS113]